MKIAVVCDLHLPLLKTASQYALLDWVVQNITEEKADLTVCIGDVCAGGDTEALNHYLDKVSALNQLFLLVNAEIRNALSKEEIIEKYEQSKSMEFQGYRIVGIKNASSRVGFWG